MGGWVSAHKVTWALLLILIVAGAHSDAEEERFSEDELAEERSSKWYTGYTASASGCPCWFDIQANDTRCACCQNGGIQCGYPKQDQCWHANRWGGVQRISRGCSDDCSLYPDQCSADATCEEVEYLPG